jgi:hypothetical protein
MPDQTLNRNEKTMVRLTPPVRRELEAVAAQERRSVSAVSSCQFCEGRQ